MVMKDHMKYLYVNRSVLHLDYQYQYSGGYSLIKGMWVNSFLHCM